MISGGNITIFVSDVGVATKFYVSVLGLRLVKRHSKHWATVSAGGGFSIGLHEKSPNHPEPGTPGAILFGLRVPGSLSSEVERIEQRGAKVERSGVDVVGKFAYLRDPDGNPFYLWSTQR
ncbi:MAG: VOC family protein [Alphaproteobacteria bacterium]